MPVPSTLAWSTARNMAGRFNGVLLVACVQDIHVRDSEQSIQNPAQDLTDCNEADIPDEIGTLCETIHIALVCMGKCMRQITPMLKSLLRHRQNPIHFHMIVDTASQHTTSKLFDTWDLPDGNHYSGIYALVKLLFPDILPATLDQVIVLDSDLTFLCDIAELW
ncbi:Uncharacterized protein OBRU01_19385, partial [Operophtera brumata]